MRFHAIALVILFVAAQPNASASIFGPGIPIPSTETLTVGSLEWVYAGPVAPNEFGPGQIELPSFRAAEGWRFATAAEWAIKPQPNDFFRPGFGPADLANPGFAYASSGDHNVYRFAPEYWSDFQHVDIIDADQGRITNGLDIGLLNGVYETWYVRNAVTGAVPEPLSLMVWGCLIFASAAVVGRGQFAKS